MQSTGDSVARKNQFFNQSLCPFISSGFFIPLLSSQQGWRSRELHLLHTICHQSHTLHGFSTSVFHPLSLSSPINLSLLLSLTTVIHSVKQSLLHLHDRAGVDLTHTQDGVNTPPVPSFSKQAIAFIRHTFY